MEKRKWYIIFLLWFLQLSSAGQYLNNGVSFARATIFGFFSMIITSIIMMIIPFLVRYSNKDLLEYNYGKKICIWNSISIFIISIVINITTNGKYIIIGGLGALIYYFINMWLFVSERNVYENEIELYENDFKFDEDVDNSNEINYDLLKPKEKLEKEARIENHRYCTKCGKSINEEWDFCYYCGNKLK